MTDELLKQAAALIQGGRFADGAAICQRLLATAPGDPSALHLLATATWKSGDTVRAETLFRQALARAPHLVPSWHSLASMLYAERKLEAAAECALRVTTLDRLHPAGWELRAAIDQKRNDLAAATAACREGLRHSPSAARLHYALAQVLREDSAFVEAARAYDLALQHGHDVPELYQNRGEALLEAGDRDAALASFRSGVERFPQNALLHRLHVRMRSELGAPGDPTMALRQAARAYPHNAALWELLADFLNRLDRRAEARVVLEDARASGCAPTAGLALLDAVGCADAGDKREATVRFERISREYPQHAGIKLAFAAHALSAGDPTRAEALCAEVLATNPSAQLAWAYRGIAWKALNDPRDGWLNDYERMVMPVRVRPPADYASADAFFRDVREALETLHRTHAQPIDQTVRGGTQTNGYLFRHKLPLLRKLEMQIRIAVRETLLTIPHEANHPFWGRCGSVPTAELLRFAGAWSVRLQSEGFHTNHIHSQGWISSALYVSLPDDLAEGAGSIQFGVPPVEMNLAIAPGRVVAPEVGLLLLFPSYMWHGTVPFASAEPRITVAFDLLAPQ